ncbi:TadE family type IV pilus minor pilin [Actinosynnema sp. NPDC050436]|uniref:TadE family type IV pilus minor pilin n=1 Tax=Actinosynnema sp. NPDC050436 TaxID=3155659 RepID=UPI0033E9C542
MEAALAVCGLVAFLVLGVEVVMTVVAQVRCTDAAREAARLVARGEPARASTAAKEIAPRGAELVVHREGDTARVEVRARRTLVEVRADAYAVLEPGVAGTDAESDAGTGVGADAGTGVEMKGRSGRGAELPVGGGRG